MPVEFSPSCAGECLFFGQRGWVRVGGGLEMRKIGGEDRGRGVQGRRRPRLAWNTPTRAVAAVLAGRLAAGPTGRTGRRALPDAPSALLPLLPGLGDLDADRGLMKLSGSRGFLGRRLCCDPGVPQLDGELSFQQLVEG